MKTLKELLIEFDAFSETREWAGDKTIEEVVKECHRGDWLLYLAKKIELHERKRIACAGHCANTVRHLMKDERSVKLVDLCMNFEDESISFEELDAARAAARAAASDIYAARAAARAAASDIYAARANDAASAAASDIYAARATASDTASDIYANDAARAAASDIYAARAADAARAAVYDCYAAHAAVAANDAARADTDYAARKENELQTANIVRERLGQDIINKVNLLLNK